MPAELRLVVACCRWPPAGDRDACVRDAAAEVADWELFARVVTRHRVEGLVHDGLRRAGVTLDLAVGSELAAAASAIARENLRHAAACVRLGQALDAAGVPHLFVKGATLGMLAYGSLAHKRAWDIDLAVEPARYREACGVLGAAGYRPRSGDADLGERAKHSEWFSGGGTPVELHASLTDNPLILPGLSARSPRQEVAVAGALSLPTLATDELYAYLCVHGAAHAWSRLKWIADLAALIAPADETEIVRLHDASQALGAGRSSGQALLLITKLFDRALPPALEETLRRDPVTRALVRTARASMMRGGLDVELDAQVLGTVPIHASHFFLQRGWRYKWVEARRKLGGGGAGGPVAQVAAWLSRRSKAAAGP